MIDPNFIESATNGLLAGGIDPETMTDDEWEMFENELLSETFRYARGWATALAVLRNLK